MPGNPKKFINLMSRSFHCELFFPKKTSLFTCKLSNRIRSEMPHEKTSLIITNQIQGFSVSSKDKILEQQQQQSDKKNKENEDDESWKAVFAEFKKDIIRWFDGTPNCLPYPDKYAEIEDPLFEKEKKYRGIQGIKNVRIPNIKCVLDKTTARSRICFWSRRKEPQFPVLKDFSHDIPNVVKKQQEQIMETKSSKLESFSMADMKKFAESRLDLIKNCMNQFIVGYHEGLGREIDKNKYLRKNDTPSTEIHKKQTDPGKAIFDKQKWMSKMGVVASKMGSFRSEVKKLTEIDEDELKAK